MSHSFLCFNCGLRVDVPEYYTRSKIRCTECGVISEVPASARKASPDAKPARSSRKRAEPTPPPVPRPPSDVVPKLAVPAGPLPPNYASTYIWPSTDEEENSDPYPVADPDRPRCPQCEAQMELNAVVCLRCGWDRRAGHKLVREYTPVVEHWEAGLPRSRRIAFFLLGQASCLVFGLSGAWLLGQLTAFLVPWVLFTVLTAFLLGTYDELDLTRDRKGRVELIRTWHVCFFRRPPAAIDLRLYEGIATGKEHEAGLFEWLVFIGLLWTVIPALMWWWVAIRQATVWVALTRDNGYADLVLYRGWNEEQARTLAATLRDVARLPK